MFSQRISRLKPSPIRDILHVVKQPGVISFAGGLPSEDRFPVIPATARPDKSVMQYGPSEGEPQLRTHITHDLSERGLEVSPEQILILSGSQQGIDLTAKLFVDEGTLVGVESPTYLAALQVFSLFGARFGPFSASAQDPQQIFGDSDDRPALVYTNPTFQNPTGYCYSLKERQGLAKACDRAATVLFEDDPYRDLMFEPSERRPAVSFLKSSSWIYQSSYSKTLAPGLRLGFLACSKDLYPPLVNLKQAADLHSNGLSQYLVLKMLQAQDAKDRHTELCAYYRAKRDYFREHLTRHFADIATWNTPRGGLFFWLTLKTKKTVDTRELLAHAIARDVTFMPGEPFFAHRSADGDGACGMLRLNFSHTPEPLVERGLQTLAEIIQKHVLSG